jgi:hypothetical protein
MIDPHWTVIDLDPHTWRNLGRFLQVPQYVRTTQPGENALFVLHDAGRPLNVYDSRRGPRPELVTGPIENPQLLAHDLFETGEWDRVHIINKQHLVEAARWTQRIENRALTLDAYYHRVFESVWKNPQGYVSLPPHPGDWHGWTYTGLKQFVKQLPTAATLALGVFDDEAVEIGLVLEFHSGLIKRVTTFEGLELSSATLGFSAKFLDQLWSRLEENFAPPAGILLCTASTFDSWIAADDKVGFLQRAAQEGTALWRLQLHKDI